MVGLFLRRLGEVLRNDSRAIRQRGWFAPFVKTIAGEPIEPREILGLDDYGLWVLIQQTADSDSGERTLVDLARRIVSRDLFKQVPVSQESLQGFLLRPDARAELEAVVRPFVEGNEKFYIHVDTAEFELLSADEKNSAYLVDVDSPAREASLARDHVDLRPFWVGTEPRIRLFAPRETVELLTRVVMSEWR